MPPFPKPDSQRRRRNAPTFDWTILPAAGRHGDPPPLPDLREWHPATLEAWASWWKSAPAIAWDQSGMTLHRWAVLYDEVVRARETGKSLGPLSSEMRAIEDRHGMSPRALLSLRWRVMDVEAEVVELPNRTAGRVPARHRPVVTD